MKFWRMTLTLATLMAATTAWAAGGRLEEINDCDPDAVVSISNVAGKVTVRPWDRLEIKINVKVGNDVERVDFSRSSSHPGVEIVVPKRTRGWSDIECDIDVMCPPGVSLDIEAVSASIDISGIFGELDLNTVSGSVDVADAADDVDIENVSGGIDVSGSMGEVEISTTSGSVRVVGAARSIDIESVSGGITLEADADDVDLSTTSGKVIARGQLGNIDVESISGRIEVEEVFEEADVASMSGSVHVRGRVPRDVSVESYSGGVNYEGGLQDNGRLDMSSKSGSVNVALPSNINASFDISTMSGGIHNDLGVGPQPASRIGPGKELDFKTGEGRGQIELESFSGSVRLKGLPPIPPLPELPPLPALEPLPPLPPQE